uniref:DNA-directed RNA polymerase subunit n=1 Tax=Clandestinovirus TaxID=2831644 RepID=A0A8F8KQ31_9VIRU|nr:DNA-directed RNA polymerase II subunit 1 [Clandestinovirus]
MITAAKILRGPKKAKTNGVKRTAIYADDDIVMNSGPCTGTDADNHFITKVQFSVDSSDDIRRRSVCEVTESTTFENGTPKTGGLLDLRMGPFDRHYNCETCNRSVADCPGHHGHLELAEPIYSPLFIPYVEKILKCVCIACSGLLCGRERAKTYNVYSKRKANILSRITEYCTKKVQRCPQCFTPQPTYSRDAMWITFTYDVEPFKKDQIDDVNGEYAQSVPKNAEYIMTARRAMGILKAIQDEDAQLLGLSKTRPENLIITCMNVPTPGIRPPVVNDSARGADTLTKKLGEIIHVNEQIKRYTAGWRPHEKYTYYQRLQFHGATYINENAMGNNTKTVGNGRMPQTQNTLIHRINGKDGRVRGNLQGKRVDFSARCVISPDPSLRIFELGVPIYVASTLTFPEVVSPLNRLRLLDACKNGPEKYPGATFVERKLTKERIDLRFKKGPVELEYGDVVHRHMINKDWVIFNRQPTLHRMSIMAHQVVVMPGSSFRLNLSVCAPYNADFDVSTFMINTTIKRY